MRQELKKLLDDCLLELNEIDQIIKELSAFDKKVKFLTLYALIKSSGTAEYVYKSIIADYFNHLNNEKVNNFITKKIRKKPSSIHYDQISSLLAEVDDIWKDEFKKKAQNIENSKRVIESSKSLIKNRHSFAHGNDVTLTISSIKQYYSDILILINIIDEIVSNETE